MNYQPNVPGTVANWTFNNTLADISGNNLTLACLDGNTLHTPGGVEQYAAIGDLVGFNFNGATKLWAPLTQLLLITGDMTIEWIMLQTQTHSETYFCAADPAGRSGGASPDRTGSVYSFFWGSPNNPYYRNYNTGGGGGGGGSFYGEFSAQTQVWGVGAVHHYAFRRSGTKVSAFVDGVQVLPDIDDWLPNFAAGTERFYVGGCEGASVNMGNNDIIGSLRITTKARTNGQIGQDAIIALGPAATPSPYPPTGASLAAQMYRYNPQAYGDRFGNPGEP